MIKLKIEDKLVTVATCGEVDVPVVYFNAFENEGRLVARLLRNNGNAHFNFVCVNKLNWNHDMTPWSAPPVKKNSDPFTGGADDYLNLLTQKIIPAAENNMNGISRRYIAGYSLGGLFALYSLYKTDAFSGAASVSGSLWFEGFKDFVFENKMKTKPERVYFSVGNKESKTLNTYMKTVENNTREIESFYRSQGIETVFELNSGNHFQNIAGRIAAGLNWITQP